VPAAIMFHSSTQWRHWTFRGEEELARCRADANCKFRGRAVASGKVRDGMAAGREGAGGREGASGREGAGGRRPFRPRVAPLKVQQNDPVLLEPHEELAICKYYEKRLLDFCGVFKPAMPRSVVVSGGRGR